ncbi:MAG: DUF5658 family protein [Candidatus Binatia bacterium]
MLLQLIDGLASFYILSAGVPEANPVVALAIENWGLTQGLLYSKLLGCALLVLVFMLGHKVGRFATRGMMILAGVYSCLGVALIVKMFVLFA